MRLAVLLLRDAAADVAVRGALLAALVVGCAAWLTGCGASAVTTSARAATVAAVATQGAARVVEQSSRAAFETECPAPADPVACGAEVKQRWHPADAAVRSTKAALVAWIEALNVARIAGDGAELWQPLALAAARMVSEYAALREVLAALGVELPALPEMVVTLAESVGGR